MSEKSTTDRATSDNAAPPKEIKKVEIDSSGLMADINRGNITLNKIKIIPILLIYLIFDSLKV